MLSSEKSLDKGFSKSEADDQGAAEHGEGECMFAEQV